MGSEEAYKLLLNRLVAKWIRCLTTDQNIPASSPGGVVPHYYLNLYLYHFKSANVCEKSLKNLRKIW